MHGTRWTMYPANNINHWQLTIKQEPCRGVLIQPNVERSEALGKKGIASRRRAVSLTYSNCQWLCVVHVVETQFYSNNLLTLGIARINSALLSLTRKSHCVSTGHGLLSFRAPAMNLPFQRRDSSLRSEWHINCYAWYTPNHVPGMTINNWQLIMVPAEQRIA